MYKFIIVVLGKQNRCLGVDWSKECWEVSWSCYIKHDDELDRMEMGEKDVNQNFVKKLDAISRDGKYRIEGNIKISVLGIYVWAH